VTPDDIALDASNLDYTSNTTGTAGTLEKIAGHDHYSS